MLGTNPLLWWCPKVGPLGTGLEYQLADKDGKWVEVSARDLPRLHEPTCEVSVFSESYTDEKGAHTIT